MRTVSPSKAGFRVPKRVVTASCVILFVAGAWYAPAVAPGKHAPKPVKKTIDYNRDVRPIISKCFTCHGHDPKQIQAGLRLDVADGAYMKLKDGRFAIVPGHPEKSELIERVFAKEDYALMPPKSSNKILTKEEKETLRTWIAEGAEYKEHWAFVKPVRPVVPTVKQTAWPKNSIDRFILAKLEEKGLKPSPEADKRTLIRRVTLDITGLPPTPQEVNNFLADHSANAYEKLVDRLLASPRYGERMAMDWLDYARYADSNGYQADFERYQWRWRDWVINAFNKNEPYDKFTVEQLAGDMLPNATLDQKIATGFNRNHRINTEGGVVAEEWRVENVIDRVETTSETWLGLTSGCARCHDHKYDPIKQTDFYSLCAYFNNVPESGTGVETPVNHPPFIKAPTPEQQARLAILQGKADELGKKVDSEISSHLTAADNWQLPASNPTPTLTEGLVARYRLASPPTAVLGEAPVPKEIGNVKYDAGRSSGAVSTDDKSYVDLGQVGDFDKQDAFSYGAWINRKGDSGSPLSRMDPSHDYRGWDMMLEGDKLSVHVISKWPSDALKVTTTNLPIPMGQWTHVFATYDGSGTTGGIKVYINGQQAQTMVANDKKPALEGSIKTTVSAKIGRRTDDQLYTGQVDDVAIYHRVLKPEEVKALAASDPAAALLAVPVEKRTPSQRQAVARLYLLRNDPNFQAETKELAAARHDRDTLDSGITTVMVMEEMPKPRDCFVLVRGQYDHHGQKVTAELPPFLQIKGKTFPKNRLGFAEWIVDPGNPLTARVTMNRLWARFFGVGIVATVEDFGTRAEFPSHPELLDWLATEFLAQKWNLKGMVKEMLMSATYRQSSNFSPASAKADPANRYLARGPRFRLPAEVIRDQAMYFGGLLTEHLGGPSVRPYQPAGVWDDVNVYGNLRNYKHDKGANLYRRSLYTIWKRTAAPPTMTLFDMPSRETCRMERPRTDTPLQALTLLNDVTYVESSRALAQRMVTEGGATQEAKLGFAFRTVLSRDPNAAEMKILKAQLDKNLTRYQTHPDDAHLLIGEGDLQTPKAVPASELAAYTLVASMILNLDETINKE